MKKKRIESKKKESIAVIKRVVETEDKGISVRLEAIPIVECSCKAYQGQDCFCKIHTPKVECPKCHCIDSEVEIANPMPSVKNYSCAICGIFYLRRTEDGEYQL